MKKTMKKITSTSLALLVLLSVGSVSACKKDSTEMIELAEGTKYTLAKNWGEEELHTYYLASVGENIMPISGFAGPYTPSGISYNGHIQPDFNEDKYWQLLQDCGVNNIVFTWNEYRTDTAAVTKALDQAQKFGMSYFVRDNGMRNFYNGSMTIDEVVEPYINHPACAGVYGRDEPGGNEFESYATLIDAIYTNEKYKGKDVYMNMLPNYATSSAFGKYLTYENYIKGYMEECHNIPYLSYDYYPFRTASHNLDTMNAAGYYDNLAFIREVAMENKVPFWAYICVGELGQAEYPVYPTKEGYFWNMNTLLAYGAKGLSLYSVIQSPVDEDLTDAAADPIEGKNYMRFGLIGAMGNVNRWYHYQKEYNQQLQLIDEYLMNAQNMGVFAVGNRAKYLGEGDEIIKNCAFRELKKVLGDEVIVGCFDYHGSTLLYVVNNDIDNKQRITLNFDGNYGYDIYQRGTVSSVATKALTLTMEAGEGVLVKLRTE